MPSWPGSTALPQSAILAKVLEPLSLPAVALESLESRQLFSVINVANYGINGNDASGAIQAAFNASQSGDTILFPAGTYNIGHQLTVPGHRILQGNNAKLVAPRGAYAFQNDKFGDSNGDKFYGFEVVGRFLRLDSWAGWTSDVEVANNTFDPYNYSTDGSNEREGIYITNGARNMSIHNNTANGTIGDGWIVGYGAQNVSITDNVIENMYEGIHYLGQFGWTSGLNISRNYFHNNHTMNVEMQGSGDGVVVEGNIIDGAWITGNFNENMNSFGFSLSGEGFNGTKVDHNKIVSWDRADGTGLREDFEVAGNGPNVYQNYIEGTNQAGVLNTSTNGQIHDNKIVGAMQGFTAFAGRSPGANIYNNGPNVGLDWNPQAYSLPNAGAHGSSPTSTYTPTPTSTATTGTWSVVNGQAALNGVVDGATNGVASVFQSNGAWYQLSTSGQVWTLPGSNAKNVTGQVSAPSGSSSPTPTPTSTSGGSWTVINGQAALNGQIDGATSNVVSVFQSNGSWYQYNTAGQVWTLPGSNAKNVTGQVSPTSASPTPTSTAGGSWTVINGRAALNGVVDSATAGVVSVFQSNGKWYQYNTVGQVWTLPGANAQNVTGQVSPTITSNQQSSGGTNLSSLAWTSATTGWSSVQKDKSINGNGLKVGGTSYSSGIGTHADSIISYAIGGKYTTFQSAVGIDQEVGTNGGSVDFQVIGDGKVLFDSGTMTDNQSKSVSVSVSGVQTLQLVAKSTGDGIDYDHADWAGAKLA